MLYIVGLPIGNLKDITLRALEVLKSVDIIACEDTRNTLKLLNHYEIKSKLMSYHKFNEQKITPRIIELLNEGKDIALVSDAGMPIVSDPGAVLVKALIENGLEYTVIPGANAAVSAFALSGMQGGSFTFVGFLPEKNKDRKELLNSFKNIRHTLIFYVSPHSLQKDIETIYNEFGKRNACLVKEITKIYETVYPFVLGNEIEINPKGEFVLLVEGFDGKEVSQDENLTLKQQVKILVIKGMKENDAIKQVAKKNSLTKQELYKMLKVK